jgi:FkbM family methyltransferase
MKSQGNSGLSSLCPWEGTAYDDYCLVGTARADDLIHRGECVPNVVKIDVEGHEFNVLSGFGDFLAHPSLRMIVFEDNRSDDVHGLLGAAGFRVQRISSSESCAVRLV